MQLRGWRAKASDAHAAHGMHPARSRRTHTNPSFSRDRTHTHFNLTGWVRAARFDLVKTVLCVEVEKTCLCVIEPR